MNNNIITIFLKYDSRTLKEYKKAIKVIAITLVALRVEIRAKRIVIKLRKYSFFSKYNIR